jgi:hypothetical protein
LWSPLRLKKSALPRVRNFPLGERMEAPDT